MNLETQKAGMIGTPYKDNYSKLYDVETRNLIAFQIFIYVIRAWWNY